MPNEPKGMLEVVKEQIKPLAFAKWSPNDKDLREDGSKKGLGYLGPLLRPDGGVSSELSIGMDFGKGEMQIPTMVPTLARNEVYYLLNTPEDKLKEADPNLFKSIIDKAAQHAKDRIKSGKDVWAEEGESPTKPPELK
jgi:hypothetical protein